MPAAAAELVAPAEGSVAGRPDRAPRVQRPQVERAVQALIKHHAKVLSERSKDKPKDLLGDTWEYIQIQLGTSKAPQQSGPKPIQLSLPHPIYSADDGFSICLIVKEDSKAAVKKALQELHIEGASEVVGLQELRTDYKQYQDRRTLRDAFDLFLVDDRVMALLGRVLGKIFFSKKKQPVPIRLGGLFKGEKGTQHVGRRITEARNSTYMYRSPGTCISVRAARTDFSSAKATENIMSVIEQMVDHTPGKWKNVQSICIKTPDSVALPIYNAIPAYLRHRPKDDTPAAQGEAAAKADAQKGDAETKASSSKGGKKRERPAAEQEADAPAAGVGKKAKAVVKESEGGKAAGLKRKAAGDKQEEVKEQQEEEGKEQQGKKKKLKQPAAAPSASAGGGKGGEQKQEAAAGQKKKAAKKGAAEPSSTPAASEGSSSSKPAGKEESGSGGKAEGAKKAGVTPAGSKKKPVVAGKAAAPTKTKKTKGAAGKA